MSIITTNSTNLGPSQRSFPSGYRHALTDGNLHPTRILHAYRSWGFAPRGVRSDITITTTTDPVHFTVPAILLLDRWASPRPVSRTSQHRCLLVVLLVVVQQLSVCGVVVRRGNPFSGYYARQRDADTCGAVEPAGRGA